jgi:hypothetical protein
MKVRKDPDTGVTTWTTPSGLTYRSLPPPALGHGSLPSEQVKLRRMLLHPPESIGEQTLLTTLIRHQRQPRPDARVHICVDPKYRHRKRQTRHNRTPTDRPPPLTRATPNITDGQDSEGDRPTVDTRSPYDGPPPF